MAKDLLWFTIILLYTILYFPLVSCIILHYPSLSYNYPETPHNGPLYFIRHFASKIHGLGGDKFHIFPILIFYPFLKWSYKTHGVIIEIHDNSPQVKVVSHEVGEDFQLGRLIIDISQFYN